MGGTVDLGRLVELVGNGVEEALDQPGVDADGPAEVDECEARQLSQTESREDVADSLHDEEDRHHGDGVGEHLDEQQRVQARAAASKPEPRECVRSEAPDNKTVPDVVTVHTIIEFQNQVQNGGWPSSESSARKLSRLSSEGTSSWLDSDPLGSNAPITTQ